MDVIKRIRNLSLEEAFRVLQYGLPKQKGTIYDLRSGGMKELPHPVFFLSTGRCGTAWFSNLISVDKSVKVLHDPAPTLAYQSKLAFKNLQVQKPKIEIVELLEELFLAGRESHLRYSYKTGRRIVETNNGISFFAPILAELFPSAKFVHLIRDPYEFISSGLRRGYYTDSNEDLKRIRNDRIFDRWGDTDRIVKISWLWYATNDFIFDFSKKYPERIYRFNFSKDLTENKVSDLLSFLEINIDSKRISKKIPEPVNVQKTGKEIRYEDWSEGQKKQFHKLCDRLMDNLNIT